MNVESAFLQTFDSSFCQFLSKSCWSSSEHAVTDLVPVMMSLINRKCLFFCLQVEKELKSICNDILDVLDKHLILAATTGESKVFYYKM